MKQHRPVEADEQILTLPLSSVRRAWLGSLRRATAVALVLIGFGAGVLVDRVAWDGGRAVGASTTLTGLEGFGVLEETWNLIQNEYVDDESLDEQALVHGAAAGMVEALGDTNHSRFLTPEEAARFQDAIRGEIIGIGVQIDVRDGRPVIAAPIDGSPADRAGIKPGDVILTIDGESADGLDFEELATLLRGEEGTEVRLTLRHEGEPDPFGVTIVRARIKVEPVSWRMLPDGVAQIRLSQFSAGATGGLETALIEAKASGATSIVLDLRDNPGGLVFEAVGVASQLMPEGAVLYQEESREGQIRTVRTIGAGQGQDLPIIVLINGNSASAAEIIAAALRDNGRATLVGETTVGTGTVLSSFELDDGSLAVIGTALWLTPEGERIWKVGVEPDIEIELEAGVYPSRPQEDPEVTASELQELNDLQLREAHELAQR